MNVSEPSGASDDCASMESINGSWIKLDSKNGSPQQTSPKLSDDEGMTEALADAQTEAARSVSGEADPEEAACKRLLFSELIQKVPDKMTESKESKVPRRSFRGSKVINSSYDFVNSPVFYVSASLLTHTFVFAVGMFVGQKMATRSR